MCYRTLIKELQDNWRILGPMTVAEGGGANLASVHVCGRMLCQFPLPLACLSLTWDRLFLSITFKNASACLQCCMELALQVTFINFHDRTAAC